MQTRPAHWAALFDGPHITEYKYVINGVDYSGSDIQGTPVIKKPLMDAPAIGHCSSGSLSITIRKKSGVSIPKAASVIAYARLASRDGVTVTAWVQQGHYCISRRRESAELAELTCYDLMAKAGTKYADRTTITQWPATMTAVVAEIAAIMGVSVDSRTVIRTEYDYMVDYPDDRHMSEILGMIGAAHCGNWIITEKGKLRLIPFTGAAASAKQALGTAFKQFRSLSTPRTITRITLTDNADNQFTVGTDAGMELASECDYATQMIVADNAEGCYVSNGTAYGLPGPVNQMTLTANNGSVAAGAITLPGKSVNIPVRSYMLDGAYLDPCIELGDTISISKNGEIALLLVASLSIRCNQSFNADVSFESEEDDEDEYPYTDLSTLRMERYVSTEKAYYGNRLNRSSGFTSELVKNGVSVARLIANASTFAMQQYVDGAWQDRIFFDPINRKYKITGDVAIEGVLTAADVGENGSTVINGSLISTGEISADRIRTGTLESVDKRMMIDLNTGTMDFNSNFKVLEDGSLEANKGTFAGILAAPQGSVGALVAGPNGITINGSLSVTGDYPAGAVTPEGAGLSNVGNYLVTAPELSKFGTMQIQNITVTDGTSEYTLLLLGSRETGGGGGGGGGGGQTVYQVIQLKSSYPSSYVTIRSSPSSSGSHIGELHRNGWAIIRGNVGNSWWEITGLCNYSGSGNNGTITNTSPISGYAQIGTGSVNGPYTTTNKNS